MSVLSELNTMLDALDIPVETGVFKGKAPDEYVVITPLTDTFGIHADNRPRFEVQEARLSLFSKSNYQQRKKQIVGALLDNGFTVTDRRYIGHEDDTGYHHYAIDVAKEYELRED
ncbi:conserved hypothetical protein [Heliomicrobium modesticaldum Ice1]|uniref:Uncharacterized protein n=1 Tax=Heliobacterium modesticaldum (strain ATCC 51547 / Ice1) TaxID=498761 RepID=B0TD23_HELMI|nr:hypothetical protein [Heliomicrobium modesticaldum]ABZ85474.1 conserved hypothetical protein [Heliomicrobium modesticaldum Ice1]